MDHDITKFVSLHKGTNNQFSTLLWSFLIDRINNQAYYFELEFSLVLILRINIWILNNSIIIKLWKIQQI